MTRMRFTQILYRGKLKSGIFKTLVPLSPGNEVHFSESDPLSWGIVYQRCFGKLIFKVVPQVPLAIILHFNILNKRACNLDINYFAAKIIFLNSVLFLFFFFFKHPCFLSKSSNASLKLRRKPRESDFETIKLISNGAYGWVIQENSIVF